MESITELYRIGHGPSSSHTMGPRSAAEAFAAANPGSAAYRVTLYGSLAATGRGHLTDRAIIEALEPMPVDILWRPEESLPFHPNAMYLEAISAEGYILAEQTIYSVGGGKTVTEAADGTESLTSVKPVYELSDMASILQYLGRTDRKSTRLNSSH